MTRFADSKFSVAALPTVEYAEGHARTFAPQGEDKKCTACRGQGKLGIAVVRTELSTTTSISEVLECAACNGTGLRAWQRSA